MNRKETITSKETRLQNKSVVRNVFLFQFIAYHVDTLGQLLSLASKPECLGTKGWSVSCKRDMLWISLMEGTEIIGKLIVCVEDFPVTRGLGEVARAGLVVHSTRDLFTRRA